MASPSTPTKATRSAHTPVADSPFTQKVSHAAVSSPGMLGLEAKRENVLKDLSEAVPQLPVEFFLTKGGILPPLTKGLDLQKIIDRLIKGGDILRHPGNQDPNFPLRWKHFEHDPSKDNNTENDIFYNIEKIVAAIKRASNRSKKEVTLDIVCNPDRIPIATTRDNSTRPDCYGVLPKPDSDAEKFAKDGSPMPYWFNIGVPAEFKKKTAQEVQNWTQILWSLNYIMQEDPRRRFVFAFTIEDTNMRIWLASRSDVLVSLPFNFIEQYEHTIEFFLRIVYASEEDLGWDNTIERIPRRSPSEPFQYDIKCADATYRTVRMISELGAEALRGRGTRVWEVCKIDDNDNVDPHPLVLKDAWVDSDRKREHIILQKVREAATEKGLLEGFERHFMKIRAAGDVFIGEDADHTHDLILRRRSRDEGSKGHLNVRITPPPKSSQAPVRTHIAANEQPKSQARSEPLGAKKLPEGADRKILQYHAKVHYRIVFEDLGCTVAETETLSDSLEALIDAVKGLKILHQCGWVHRDISTGNILVVNGVGKLSDLEYAKCEDDKEKHGVRTGTPDFMATEVQAQYYHHKPDRKRRRKNVMSASQAVAMSEQEQAATVGQSATTTKDSSTVQGVSDPPSNSSTLPNATLKPSAKKPYDADEFRHNPLHDLESVLWVVIWLLVCSKTRKAEQNSDEDWISHLKNQGPAATSLFRDIARRIHVIALEEIFAESFEGLLTQVGAITEDLNDFRHDLHQQYYVAENERYLARSQPPFATMCGTLHDSLAKVLSGSVKYLRTLKWDLHNDEASWTVDHAKVQLAQSEKVPATTSGSGKRTSDAAQMDSRQHIDKRLRISSSVADSSPLAGPSRVARPIPRSLTRTQQLQQE